MWKVRSDSPCRYIKKDDVVRIDFVGSHSEFHDICRVSGIRHSTHRQIACNKSETISIIVNSGASYAPPWINSNFMCNICIHHTGRVYNVEI